MLLSESVSLAIKYPNNTYHKYLETVDKELESLIEKDVSRTSLSKINKKTKEIRKSKFLDYKNKRKNLFNILKVYGLFDKDVNYCQGTNYIVALMLYNIDSERAVFWAFHQFMNKFLWRYIYLNNTPKLIRLMESFKKELEEKCPIVHEHFEKLKVNSIYQILIFKPLLKLFI